MTENQEILIANYEVLLTSATETEELKKAYPAYIKMLKFKYDGLSKAVIFLNRYLVSTLTDDEKLILLTGKLAIYLAGRDTDPAGWKAAHDEINAMMEDKSFFNTVIERTSVGDVNDFVVNENTDDTKLADISAVEEIDDGSKSLFVDTSSDATVMSA